MPPSCRPWPCEGPRPQHEPSPPPPRPPTLPSHMQRYERAKSQPRKNGIVTPRDFILSTARPLHAMKKASLTLPELKTFQASVSELDFNSGLPVNSNGPALLKLSSVDYIRAFVHRVRPWDEFYRRPFLEAFVPWPPRRTDTYAMQCYRPAANFSTFVDEWLAGTCSKKENDSLLYETPWRHHFDDAASKWLGAPFSNDYIWENRETYHSLDPILDGDPGCPGCRRDLPHAIYHAVDSTPFNDSTIRMSEFKSIVFLAILNHMKAEYNHLDYFGVTVLSFWNRDVRIVQGLVNLKTHNIDLRMSAIQHFPEDIWVSDDTIDVRFLTLLAYNCGQVIPQPT